MGKDSNLSKKDICDIIKSIGKSNISHLEYHGLKIIRDMESIPGKRPKSTRVSKEPPETYFDQQEYDNKVGLISTLHIEDPEEYERLLMSGELTDKVGSNGKDSSRIDSN